MVEQEYLIALGRATYNFALLEHNMRWLGEVLQPGFLAETKGMTAGHLSQKLINLCRSAEADDADQLDSLSQDFEQLCKERNGLLHGTPITAHSGEQRLEYDGKSGAFSWSIERIYEFASDSANLSSKWNDVFHTGRYQKYCSEITTGRK